MISPNILWREGTIIHLFVESVMVRLATPGNLPISRLR
jgi:hypothetical protein